MLLVAAAIVLTVASCFVPPSCAEGPEVLLLEPNSDVTVSVNSPGNVTFECAVDAGSSLLWQVNFVQLQCNSPTDRFIVSHAENGIFRDDTLDCNNSTLTITPLWFGNPDNQITRIKCIAFNLADATCSAEPPGNDFHNIIAFDRPDAPGNLRLEPSKGSLFLVWERPDVPAVIPVNYTVYINSTEMNPGQNFGPFEVGTNASYLLNFLFLDPEEGADGNTICSMFEFFVVAQNDAGLSDAAVVDDTVPISPDVTNISSSLRVGSVRHLAGNTVSFMASFQSVSSCSETFPVLNYTISLDGLEGQVVITNPPDAGGAVLLTEEVNSTVFPGLVQDSLYSLSVNACSVVICRQSDPVTVSTYSLQGASVVFFENNVRLTCVFARGSSDAGCVFRLIPSIGSTESIEEFNITRNGTESGECAIVDNQRDGYSELTALEWEPDRSLGQYSIPASDMVLEDSVNYTQLTQCSLPGGGPDVARIVAPIVVVLVTLLLVAVAIVLVLLRVSHKFQKKKNYHKVKADEHLGEANKHKQDADKHKQDADRHKQDADRHRLDADYHKEVASKHKEEAEEMKSLLTPKKDPNDPSNIYWDLPMDTMKELFETRVEEPAATPADRLTTDYGEDDVDFGEDVDFGADSQRKSLVTSSLSSDGLLSTKRPLYKKTNSVPVHPMSQMPKKSLLLVELRPKYLRVQLKTNKFVQKSSTSSSTSEGEQPTSHLLSSQLTIDPELDIVMEDSEGEEEVGSVFEGVDGAGTASMATKLIRDE